MHLSKFSYQEFFFICRAKEVKLQMDAKTCAEDLTKQRNEVRNIDRELRKEDSNISEETLTKIESEILSVSEKMKEEEKKLNVEEVNEEIEDLKFKRGRNDKELAEIMEIIKKMNSQATSRVEYDVKIKDLEECNKKIKILKTKHADEFEHIFGGFPSENLQSKLNQVSNDLQDKLRNMRTRENALNKKKTELDMQIQNHQNDLERKQNEIKKLQSKIEERTSGNTLEEALDKTTKLIDTMGKEQGELSSSITILNRYVEKLQQKDLCPLCHRDFDCKESVTELIEELQEKVQSIPNRLDEVKKKVNEQKVKKDSLVELKPQRETLNQLIKECDNINVSLEQNKKDVNKTRTELEECSEDRDMLLNDEEMVKRLRGDIALIDNNLKKKSKLDQEITKLKEELGKSDFEMSMDEALKKQSELNESAKDLRRSIEEKQKTLESHKTNLDRLKDQQISLSKKHMEMKEKLQKIESLNADKSKLEKEIIELNAKKDEIANEVAPLRSQISNKSREKDEITEIKESWLQGELDSLGKIQEREKNIKKRQIDIMNYIDNRYEEKFKEAQDEVQTLKVEIEGMENEKKKLEGEIKSVQKELTEQTKRKHNLDEEKKARDKEEHSKKLQEEIKALNETIKGFKYESILREKNNLNIRLSEMNDEKQRYSGQRGEKKLRIEQLKRDLQKREYREAEKNYRENVTKIKCLEIATNDLDKYYKALSSAIMKFHHEKMANINRIIRELWRSTYRGNDIDTIEIMVDESESQGADKRKNYNYRVVMNKNGKEMDMRGRCSAGQKVLSSLIIRIALAETLSSNCGILALDEPTTNLDRENINSLAEALLCIVKRRSIQKNFQLIIITHDSEFLDILTRADHLDHIVQVTRNEEGKSIINKLSPDLLL